MLQTWNYLFGLIVPPQLLPFYKYFQQLYESIQI